MSYLDWSLGGLVPSWIVDVKWGFGGASSSSGTSAGRADSTVTLHCATTTRDEIEQFKAIMTPVFTNTNLLNGGTDLQVSPDGHILIITNGPYTWNGIISSVQFDEDEYATIDGEAAIEFDIIVELQRGVLSAPVVNNCICISQGFDQDATSADQTINLGTFNFNWDGTGEVWLVSACNADPTTDTVSADDSVRVSTSLGTLSFGYNGDGTDGVINGPPLNITSILQEGNNSLGVTVVNIYMPTIGCSGLYLTQTAGSGNGLSPGQSKGSGSGSSTYTPISIKVTAGISQPVAYTGQAIVLGQIAVNWDGNGKVYLTSSPTADPAHDQIWLDDQVYIETNLGSITKGYHVNGSNATIGGDIEITSLLSKGNNTVLLVLQDVYGNDIGCSSLYMIQVNS